MEHGEVIDFVSTTEERDPHQCSMTILAQSNDEYNTLHGSLGPLLEYMDPGLHFINVKLSNPDNKILSDTLMKQAQDLPKCQSGKVLTPALSVLQFLHEEGMLTYDEAKILLQSKKNWKFHHKIELAVNRNGLKQSMGVQAFYSPSPGQPLWAVNPIHTDTEYIRFQYFTRDFPAMVDFYRLILGSEVEISKPGFCAFSIYTKPGFEVQLALKASTSLVPFPVRTASLRFKIANLDDIVPILGCHPVEVTATEYCIQDPDGNWVILEEIQQVDDNTDINSVGATETDSCDASLPEEISAMPLRKQHLPTVKPVSMLSTVGEVGSCESLDTLMKFTLNTSDCDDSESDYFECQQERMSQPVLNISNTLVNKQVESADSGVDCSSHLSSFNSSGTLETFSPISPPLHRSQQQTIPECHSDESSQEEHSQNFQNNTIRRQSYISPKELTQSLNIPRRPSLSTSDENRRICTKVPQRPMRARHHSDVEQCDYSVKNNRAIEQQFYPGVNAQHSKPMRRQSINDFISHTVSMAKYSDTNTTGRINNDRLKTTPGNRQHYNSLEYAPQNDRCLEQYRQYPTEVMAQHINSQRRQSVDDFVSHTVSMAKGTVRPPSCSSESEESAISEPSPRYSVGGLNAISPREQRSLMNPAPSVHDTPHNNITRRYSVGDFITQMSKSKNKIGKLFNGGDPQLKQRRSSTDSGSTHSGSGTSDEVMETKVNKKQVWFQKRRTTIAVGNNRRTISDSGYL
ncbi:unnamed protein product [Owenia fusiformis]|uniref:Uncharacterized protein n=1 Tax=Owenia fusiformis TaxID=6347 RepID=A0A8J1U2U6_OWEFU|nr:unnamed protein product [Owenia fusiformis]